MRIYVNKKEKDLYTNNIEKTDLVNIVKYAEKAKGEKINRENVHRIYTRSKSEI